MYFEAFSVLPLTRDVGLLLPRDEYRSRTWGKPARPIFEGRGYDRSADSKRFEAETEQVDGAVRQ